MKKTTLFAILAATAAVTAAAVTVISKKKKHMAPFCCYDAGDLAEDGCCCECDVCADDLDVEDVPAEDPDYADCAADEEAPEENA